MTTRWRWAAVPLILASSVWIAGCSSSSSSSSSAAATATTAVAATTPAAGTTTATTSGIPEYKPSTVTSSEHVGPATKTVLTSPDSTDKVAAFYSSALQSADWQMSKTTKSGDTVEYRALKSGAAVEIEISSAGTGSSITVKVVQ